MHTSYQVDQQTSNSRDTTFQLW